MNAVKMLDQQRPQRTFGVEQDWTMLRIIRERWVAMNDAEVI